MRDETEWSEARSDGWNGVVSEHSQLYNSLAFPNQNQMGMLDSMPMSSHLLHTLQQCAAMCEHMHSIVAGKADLGHRGRQIQSLLDCAEMCSMCSNSIARRSPLSRKLLKVCARACELCSQECLRFTDAESQNCGHMCIACAEECRRMAQNMH